MSDGLTLTAPTGVSGLIKETAFAASRPDLQGRDSDPEKVATDFESFLIFTMLKEMQKTTMSSKKSFMQETYMSVVYEKLGEYLAGKGVGIKEAIMRYLERDDTKVSAERIDNSVSGDNPIRQSVLSGSVTNETGNGKQEEQL